MPMDLVPDHQSMFVPRGDSHRNAGQDVWICLICGHVGCGRYREGHAVDHWRASG